MIRRGFDKEIKFHFRIVHDMKNKIILWNQDKSSRNEWDYCRKIYYFFSSSLSEGLRTDIPPSDFFGSFLDSGSDFLATVKSKVSERPQLAFWEAFVDDEVAGFALFFFKI